MAGAALDEDAIARLRLIRTPSIGPITYFQLIQRFGSAHAALELVPELARRGGGAAPAIVARAAIEREAATVAAAGGAYLFIGRAPYPQALAETETAPPVLTILGDVALLHRPLVAMVGARNASAAAVRFARLLAHDLAAEGQVVVSGLARGIDAAAHEGALAGGTIGVVAGGLDVFYPPENEPLQRAIAERGLVIAEQPPGIAPRARHFPYRNRIIAGLTSGTVVIEAAPRSGSLITARLAAEAGREVMAVPGSPLDPRAQGCNQLIRDGATLVQDAAEVLEALRPLGAARLAARQDAFAAPPDSAEAGERDRRSIIALLGPVPTPVDELVRQSHCAPAIVQTVLLELELAARLDRHAGGRVSLRA